MGPIGPTFFQDNPKEIRLLEHPYQCKFSFYFAQRKTYFFYVTHLFLQNTHISLSILHIYSIKYSFFYHFLLFSSLIFFTASLSLSDPTTINITTRSANHSRSNQPKIKNPFKPKPTQFKTQIITHPPTRLFDTPSFWDAKMLWQGLWRIEI